MITTVLDTGPLFAALDEDDQRHAECAAFLKTLKGRCLLPSAVVTEVCWLLERGQNARLRSSTPSPQEPSNLVHLNPDDLTRMGELIRTYADFPLGSVDAAVIAVAERYGVDRVATLDHRHFRVIRPKHVSALTLLP